VSSAGILKISEAASLGLHAMMILAGKVPAMVSASEISEILHASEATLAKVLQRLAKVGLVKSTRGPKGGFLLGKPPQKINLLEVYEAIEGPLLPVSCLLHQPVCPDGKCIFGDIVKNIHGQIAQHLANTTLAPLIK
jgi:Rrf2 family protein